MGTRIDIELRNWDNTDDRSFLHLVPPSGEFRKLLLKFSSKIVYVIMYLVVFCGLQNSSYSQTGQQKLLFFLLKH